VTVDAPLVTLPAATFTAAGVELAALDVTGTSTLTTVTATTLAATTSVTTPVLTVADPANDGIEITAASVTVKGDLHVEGTIGTPAGASLVVENKVLSLASGAALTDVDRDAAGIVVPGKPEYLPLDKVEANYEHSIRWKRREGDFATTGDTMAPHQKPRWTFSGGCVSISGSDASEWFIAPHVDPVTNAATLGIYYQGTGVEAVLVQSFRSVA
jgi:hypothetical protein